MENFTFQLRGTKRWKLRSTGVRHPVRGCTPHFQTTSNREQQIKAARLQAESVSLLVFIHVTYQGGAPTA